MFRKVVILLFPAALIMVLAACGPSKESISVTAGEFQFSQGGNWSVSAGNEVEVTLKNIGTVKHEWAVLKQGTSVTMPFDEDDEDKVFWEIEAEPGETKTASFTAPSEPGTYTIVCGISGHLEEGMDGTLTVN